MNCKESICRNCFHSYVCEQFNENKDDNNEKCHFFNDHYVPTADVVLKNEWISVDDRLPECEWGAESEAVLYITKQGFMYTGYYGCGGIFHDRYFREYKNSTEGCDISNVTHWMPLPSPPTEKEN